MSGIQKLIAGSKEILTVDYSDCTEHEMMALAGELSGLVIAGRKKVLALCTLNNENFFTPKVMRHFEKITQPTNHLIDKMGLVGLNSTKRIILKGYNLLFKRDFGAFNDREEAISYLIRD